MPEFFTVEKGGKKKQVLAGKQLDAARSDGWEVAGTKRVTTETGERTLEAGEAIKRVTSGEADSIVGEDVIRQRAGKVAAEKRYADDGVQAFGYGGLSSVPLVGADLSRDIAEWSTGDAGEVQGIKEAHPGKFLAGEVVGTVAQAVAPFGPGAAISKGATRAGKALGGKSKIGQYAIEGAIDNAAWATNSAYANAVIADKPVNVENIIAGLPSEMMFGAGAGAAVGALGRLSRRIDAKKVSEAAKKSDTGVDRAIYDLEAQQLKEAAAEANHKLATLQNEAGTSQAAIKAAKQEAVAAEKAWKKSAKDVAKATSSADSGLTQGFTKFANELTEDIVAATKHSTSAITEEGGKAMLSPTGSLRNLTKADFDALGPVFRRELADRLGKEVSAVKLGDYRNFVAKQAQQVNQSARNVKKMAGGKKFLDLDADGFNKFADEYTRLQKLQNDYANMLRPGVGGRSTTATVQPLNLSKLDQLADANPSFNNQKFFDETGAVTEFGDFAEKQLGLKLDNLSDPTSEALARVWASNQAIKQVDNGLEKVTFAQAQRDIAQQRYAQTQANAGGRLDEIATAKQIKADVAREFQMHKAQPRPAGVKEVAEKVEPSGLFGLAGNKVRQMTELVTSGPQKIKSGVERFISFAGKKRMRGTVPAASTVLSRLRFDPDVGEKPKKGNRKAEFKRVARELNDVATNPDKAKEKINKSLAEYNTLKPGLSDALMSKAMQRLMFLHGILPQSPNVSAFGPDRWQASQTEIDKFARIAAAAEDPYSILDELNSGKLTQEAVDTVKQLYPEIYHSIQMEIVERADEIKQSVDYKGRLQLGILFGVPTDTVLEPTFVRMMQENYAIRTQEQEQAGGQENQYSTPGNNQKAVAATATTSQRLEAK